MWDLGGGAHNVFDSLYKVLKLGIQLGTQLPFLMLIFHVIPIPTTTI